MLDVYIMKYADAIMFVHIEKHHKSVAAWKRHILDDGMGKAQI